MSKETKIKFILHAYTDPAGKYEPGAVKDGNEDNLFVCADLTDPTAKTVSQDETMDLGRYGMLMAVADGMGGMNAGEVASQIAVDTLKAAFEPDKLTPNIVATVGSRQKYLEKVIREADRNIISQAKKNSEQEGMGSTIIIAWLYGNDLTISWCGDSRAYLFNEKNGIRLISLDHSYVQDLVNKGILTYDQTFDHPQGNIIMRSLGDPNNGDKGESKTIKVGKGDIILLCSDGLSGVLRDRKGPYPEENLEDIIRANQESMRGCREALFAAAERGHWYDNVTAILCKIVEGPESVPIATQQTTEKKKKVGLLPIITGILAVIVVALVAYVFVQNSAQPSENDTEETAPTDSTEITPTEEQSNGNVDKPTIPRPNNRGKNEESKSPLDSIIKGLNRDNSELTEIKDELTPAGDDGSEVESPEENKEQPDSIPVTEI